MHLVHLVKAAASAVVLALLVVVAHVQLHAWDAEAHAITLAKVVVARHAALLVGPLLSKILYFERNPK